MNADIQNIATQHTPSPVIPAKAGIQIVNLNAFKGNQSYALDSRLRGNDEGSGWNGDIWVYRDVQNRSSCF